MQSLSVIRGSQLLYERWLRQASVQRSEWALVEAATGRRWTFAQLMAEGEKGGSPEERVAYPSGHKAEFVVSILRAWRAAQVVCPLEAAQSLPTLPKPPEHFAHLKLTSATTGPAKCVAFTAEQLAADPTNIVATMGLKPEWPNLACISLAHSYGFSNFILPLLLHGIPMVIAAAPLPEALARAAAFCPAVTLPAVPALWRSWHEARAIPPNVKLAISAGAPLPIGLEESIYEAHNLKVHNFYGSSECGGIAYDRSTKPRKESALAGAAMENVALSLNPAGALVVSSAAVGETYWPEPQPSLGHGRFETSDLAELSAGAVLLRGRAGDLINVAGRKVAPEIIENALRRHPGVEECVVFGAPDRQNRRADSIVACIRAREKMEIAELAQFLSKHLPAWQIPKRWWFTPELQPNERGKLSRAEWRRRLESQGG